MTDDDIRQVFAELHRLGVDFGKPPGLAIGTGFDEGELLPWLRRLPDDLGHDEFAARLRQRVTAAKPNAGTGLPTLAGGRPYRWWPTVEQLHATADMLAREWDPLGARLGELTRDDVLDFASEALTGTYSGQPPHITERRIAKYLEGVEREEFGVRPSPPEQRRYLARQIMQVIVDHPGEPHDDNPWDSVDSEPAPSVRRRPIPGRAVSVASAPARRQVVGLGPRPDDPRPLDASAACSECGTLGTVAVVVRESAPLVMRFCPVCWQTARRTYLVNPSSLPKPPLDRDTPEGQIATFEWMRDRMKELSRHDARYVATAMWEDRLPFIEAAMGPNEGESPADKERHLRMLAADLVKQAPNMYGPMPPAIESFVAKYK